MRTREVVSFMRHQLLPHLPNWAIARQYIFETPVQFLFRGYGVHPSTQVADEFRVMVIACPLYDNHEVFSNLVDAVLGFLCHRGEWWREEQRQDLRRCIQTAGARWLAQFTSPRDVAEKGPAASPLTCNLLMARIVAYSWVLEGESELSLNAFQSFERLYGGIESPRPWEVETYEAAMAVKLALQQDPHDARTLLLENRRRALQHLGIERYAAAIE